MKITAFHLTFTDINLQSGSIYFVKYDHARNREHYLNGTGNNNYTYQSIDIFQNHKISQDATDCYSSRISTDATDWWGMAISSCHQWHVNMLPMKTNSIAYNNESVQE